MLGWLFIIIGMLIALFFIIIGIREAEPGVGIFGFFLALVVTIILGVSYQYHIANTEARYSYYKQVVADTRALIDSNQSLNMKDMQMGQKLQESIKELRNFEQEIKSCKLSPFSVFKPRIVLDEEIKK